MLHAFAAIRSSECTHTALELAKSAASSPYFTESSLKAPCFSKSRLYLSPIVRLPCLLLLLPASYHSVLLPQGKRDKKRRLIAPDTWAANTGLAQTMSMDADPILDLGSKDEGGTTQRQVFFL